MSTADAFTLRLPSWLCASFDLARVIANEHRARWATGVRRLDRFEMRSHERAFVKAVLSRRSNLWLFRTNQRRSCGDFVAIDMSSARRPDRRAYVMELKSGESLVIGGARLQCAQYRSAIDELVVSDILDARSPVELLYGDGEAVLAHLDVR